MKKIVKFGGSSLANAEQFQKVGEIIRSDESRRYVVPVSYTHLCHRLMLLSCIRCTDMEQDDI